MKVIVYIYINANIWGLERCSNGDADIENKRMDIGSGEEAGWDEWREYHGHIHPIICKVDRQWGCAVLLRVLKLGLCNNLRDGKG